jgi:hypothetical protein
MYNSNSVSNKRILDMINQSPLSDAEEIVDLGVLPIPGLFFESAEMASNVLSSLRLVRDRKSSLIQLDRNLDTSLYYYYKSGRVDAAHLAHVEKTADDLARAFPKNASILEIGGGAGHLMRALIKRGFSNLFVVDPSAENLLDQGYLGIRGIFPDAVVELNVNFDVVIGQHVLEHIAEPVSFLKAVASMLSETGQLWIEVPDIEQSALCDDGIHLSIIYALHSGYYDRDTLALAGAAAGLQLIRAISVDHYGKSITAVFSRSDNSYNLNLIEKSEINNKINHAIRSYFYSLAQFGSTLPPGLICWGAAERCLTILGACMAGGFQPGVICDSNPDLKGLYPSGMSNPVHAPNDLVLPINAVLILSVRNALAILEENKTLFSPDAIVYVPFMGSRKIVDILK